VKLFGYQDAETEWLRCLSAGGGAGKGFVTVPSIGDRVLLLLIDADPARALVLGGSSAQSPRLLTPPAAPIGAPHECRDFIKRPTGGCTGRAAGRVVERRENPDVEGRMRPPKGDDSCGFPHGFPRAHGPAGPYWFGRA